MADRYEYNWRLGRWLRSIPFWQGGLSNVVLAVLACSQIGLVPQTVRAEYRPPDGEPPPGETVANGSRRSCGGSTSLPLTLLTPTQHVGRTSIDAPTLAWFMPAGAPYRYRVDLFTLETGEPERVERIDGTATRDGIVQITVPTAALTPNPEGRYVWQVAIACDPERPRFNQVAYAIVDVVAVPTTMATELAAAVTTSERATLYARNGFWYDALREALATSELADSQESIANLLSTLSTFERDPQAQYLQRIAELLNRSTDPES